MVGWGNSDKPGGRKINAYEVPLIGEGPNDRGLIVDIVYAHRRSMDLLPPVRIFAQFCTKRLKFAICLGVDALGFRLPPPTCASCYDCSQCVQHERSSDDVAGIQMLPLFCSHCDELTRETCAVLVASIEGN